MDASPDTIAALRQALPPELHHFVEPLAQYLDAAAALRDLTQNPQRAPALAAALQQLQGKELVVGQSTVVFGTDSHIGDVEMRDVAGRDIVHIHLYGGQLPTVDDDQRRLFGMLSDAANARDIGRVEPSAIARILAWPERDVRAEIACLATAGYIHLPFGDDHDTIHFRILPEGRKLLRTLDHKANS